MFACSVLKLVGFEYPHGIMSLQQKPKRIRTAFSPNQLVRLEASFDSNPYVVGQERRDLAVRLGLTETQVCISLPLCLLE